MPFPKVIDNTMRSAWRKCPQSFKRSFIENLAPRVDSPHLHAGAAFAAGLAEARLAYYGQWKEFPVARAVGLEALCKAYGPYDPGEAAPKKSFPRMVDAYYSYLEQYPFTTDFLKPASVGGKLAVEFSFCLPLVGLFHPDTHDPIMYAGRFDMIAEYNDTLVVVDEKTTSSLGNQWSEQWALDSQFTGYLWAVQQYGIPVTGAVVRGVGIYADRVDVVSLPLHRTEHQIERWHLQLHRDIQAMLNAYCGAGYDYALDKHSCAAYGGCAFRALCLTEPNDQNWLSDYRHRLWEPTKSNPEIPLDQL